MIQRQAISPAIAAINTEIDELKHISTKLRLLANRQPANAPSKIKIVGKKTALSTVEMTRQVLTSFGKIGGEMSYQDISSGIKEMFKVDAAPSLNQMVYKRSGKGGEFYRTKEGKYGLISWKKAEAA